MLQRLAPRIANVSLRTLAMGSKFLLILVLARLLEPAEVGLYGLLVATVSLGMLILGGEYYTYSQRELLAAPGHRWSFVLQHQATAILILYALLLPLQILIFVFELLPWTIASWFLALLIAEHLGQEINRLLIAMQRQLLASCVIFLRNGLPVWVALPILWLAPDARNLETVLAAWLLCAIAAIAFGTGLVWHTARPWRRWPYDWVWLRRGFGVGLLILGATVSVRGLQTFDRFSVEALLGPDMLGVYVLYATIALGIVNVLEPAVFAFLYPRLVAARRAGDTGSYRSIMRELSWSTTAVAVTVALVVAAVSPWLFEWIGNPIYGEHLPLLWILLGMGVLYGIGMVPHYGLYAHGSDRAILAANVSALPVFAATLWALAPALPREATALALVAAFTWIALFKLFAYRQVAGGDPLTGVRSTERTAQA